MRVSPQRHVLAVLRTTIGLTQKEMGELLECSTATIQAIELGKLKMSDRLAKLLFVQTGVSSEWLAKGDPTVPPVGEENNKPYTRQSFETHRAEIFHSSNDPLKASVQLFDSWNIYIRHIELFSLASVEAYRQEKSLIFSYKSMMNLLETIRECDLYSQELKEAMGRGQRFDGNPEIVNQANVYAMEFAQKTFTLLRESIAAKGTPLSAEEKKFLKGVAKGFKGGPPAKAERTAKS